MTTLVRRSLVLVASGCSEYGFDGKSEPTAPSDTTSTAAGPDATTPTTAPPATNTTGTPPSPCDTEPMLVSEQILTFPSPRQTLGACPWNIDDNLREISGVMAARHEVEQSIEPPDGAVLCSASFHVPSTSMYYDDFVYLLFNDVVILAPSDWSANLITEDGLLIYDWVRIRGTPGGSSTWCPGAASTCVLPGTEQNGSVEVELDQATQDALFARAADQGRYAVTVAATGDDDSDRDCDHSTLDLEVTYEYVVP
jgi:hypothetical protein